MSEWSPPVLPPSASGRIRGALGGTELYERGRHAELRARIEAFVGTGPRQGSITAEESTAGGGVAGGHPPPQDHGDLAVEIGFDHGMRILDHARRWPGIRWLGVEIREHRVLAAAPHAPPNCLLVRADARTIVSALLPAGSVSWVYVLFPTPATNPRHLLLTPPFVEALRVALAPGGVVHVATDVRGMAEHAEALFSGWPEGEVPPMGPVISRRERVCARDGLPVYRLSRARPEGG